jgi:RNA polymerase sigma-70 factor, ECF subfamily
VIPLVLGEMPAKNPPNSSSANCLSDFLPLTEDAALRFAQAWTGPILSQLSRFRLPADLAEDVAQEVLLRALRALPKFRGDSKLSTWLYAITFREGIRARHKFDRQKKRESTLSAIPDPATPPLPDALAQLDDLARIRSAMEFLPLNHRLALGYHYLEGLSVAQIAKIMQAAPGSVKAWLKRGRDRLRLQLDSPDLS